MLVDFIMICAGSYTDKYGAVIKDWQVLKGSDGWAIPAFGGRGCLFALRNPILHAALIFFCNASCRIWEKLMPSSIAFAFSHAGSVTVRLTDLVTPSIRTDGM